MKVYTSKYRNHWVSPYVILTKICFWERDEDRIYNLKDEANNPYDLWVKILEPLCQAIQKFLDLVHPRINYIKLDRWDTWSFDHTLADIILPGLRQLQADKHGAPHTDDEDVPEYLRSHMAQPKEYEWDIDSLHFQRWDWILKEMIWAFEQKVADDAEDQFFDHSERNNKDPWDPEYVGPGFDKEGYTRWHERKTNGFRLFGKYYENLWD
jgi:hypothetical protein